MTSPGPAPNSGAPAGGSTQDAPRRRRTADLTPLRESPAFARLYVGLTIAGIGTFVTLTAVGLQVYDITGSTFMVGMVGGVALVPTIVAGVWGGMLADVMDRRTLAIWSQLVTWVSVLALVALSFWDAALADGGTRINAWWFILVATVNAVAATVSNATRSALIGRIVAPHLLSRATALNGIAMGIRISVGPAIAGIVAAVWGLPWTFVVDAVLFTFGFIGIYSLPKLPPLGEPARAGWSLVREGLVFLRRAPNIRMSFLVDIVAMTFGRPHALLPALAVTVVGGGALTVGALTAAGAIGTLLTGLFSGPVAHVHRHGVAIARAIYVYGAFVLAFGVAILAMLFVEHDPGEGWGGIYWPAMIVLSVAMLGMGASDEVSAIFRQTMMIQAVPDQYRGRLQGVFIVVVTGGPRLGDLYVGVLVAAVALWFPPLVGGIAIVALVATLSRLRSGTSGKTFRDYDDRAPVP